MALVDHIESLKRRHDEIDMQLSAERSHPAQDHWLISQLKRQKLSLKDDISRLSYSEKAA